MISCKERLQVARRKRTAACQSDIKMTESSQTPPVEALPGADQPLAPFADDRTGFSGDKRGVHTKPRQV